MKHKIQYIIIVILVLLIGYLSVFSGPNVNFFTEINNISNEDYQNILNGNQITSQENKNIDNFKYLSATIKIKAPYIFVKNIKINTYGLEQYLNNNNIKILGDGTIDTHMEKREQVLVYLNNIDERTLKNILKDFKYVVEWSNIWNKINKENYYFNDYLK